jgi:hypothetical protein
LITLTASCSAMLIVMSAPHPSGSHVQCDDVHRVLGAGTCDHPEPDRSAAGDHDGVFEIDLGTFDGVQRARQRLCERRMLRGDVTGNLVHQRLRGIHHVARHRAGSASLEAVEVMRLAHVVLAPPAEPAFPARHDLLGHHPVAHCDPPPLGGRVVELDDAPGELMPGDDHGLGPGGAALVAPELRRAVVALQIAGADADGLHLDQGFARPQLGHCHLFEAIVARPVTDHGLHFLRDLVGHP